jgi:predicted transcriptional regulator
MDIPLVSDPSDFDCRGSGVITGPVAEYLVTQPKALGVCATVGEARREFEDDHVHMLLVVDDGLLLGTIVAADVADLRLSDGASLLAAARLEGRTVAPDASAGLCRRTMLADGIRRLAVADEAGRLFGLLCLKRSGRGFCSDADVADRAAERSVG